MRAYLRQLASRQNLTLYVVGGALVLLGLNFDPSVDPAARLDPTLAERFLAALAPLGLSVIVTAIVAAVLNHSFQLAIHNRFSIIKGAEGAGITRLFQNRKAALGAIEESVRSGLSSLDILCISGTDFLQPHSTVLKEIDRHRRARNSLKVRVLVLDPRSPFAIERSLREEREDLGARAAPFDYFNSKLCEDIFLAMRQIERILQDRYSDNESPLDLRMRLATAAPVLMYVSIDDAIFVEQYHQGIPKPQMNSTLTRCLGKSVPVLEVAKASDLGQIFASHFAYVWQRSKTREIQVGTTQALKLFMQDKDWLETYHQDEASREHALALTQLRASD